MVEQLVIEDAILPVAVVIMTIITIQFKLNHCGMYTKEVSATLSLKEASRGCRYVPAS
jgi:hypothetical protein